MKYNDAEYTALANEIIGDIFYSNASYGTKIAAIRRYAEIIVRRLIHRDTDKPLTLGNEHTVEKLERKKMTEPFFQDALKKVNSDGSTRTHTQKTATATASDFDTAVDGLFDLYAYLFVDFFKHHSFGENPEIITSFSILPPIIRYKALNELYVLYPDNTSVIDHCALAAVKAFGLNGAIDWLEQNKSHLQSLTYDDSFTSETFSRLIEEKGLEYANIIMSLVAEQRSESMYDICMKKVQQYYSATRNIGPLYDSFESALKYYKKHGPIQGNSPDIQEFNALMQFVYMGRKESEDVIKSLDDNELIITQISFFIPPSSDYSKQ